MSLRSRDGQLGSVHEGCPSCCGGLHPPAWRDGWPVHAGHTATVDTHVSDGDAKVWGTVEDVLDDALHQRYAEALFAETGFDLRGRMFEHFFQVHLVGGASVEVGENHMDVTTWREGGDEQVMQKH